MNLTGKTGGHLALFNNLIKSLFIKISVPYINHRLLIVVYRPPSSPLHESNRALNQILRIMLSEKIEITSWETLKWIYYKYKLQPVYHNVLSSGIYAIITKPNRNCQTTSTLIDNIFTNTNYNFTAGVFSADISDHFPVLINVLKPWQTNNRPTYTRYYSPNNINKLISDGASQDWHATFCENDCCF